MIAFDTNLLVYSLNASAPRHAAATAFLRSLHGRNDVVVAEQVLVETYQLLRNRAVFRTPARAPDAVQVIERFRAHPRWALVDWPGTRAMSDQLWRAASEPGFARRRLFDARLALTLRHHGVTSFATANTKDFADAGFARVWDPTDP